MLFLAVTEVSLSLRKPENLVRFPFESRLCVEVLRPLFGKRNGFLGVVPSEPMKVGLVL